MKIFLSLILLFASAACQKSVEKPEPTYAPAPREGDPIAQEKVSLMKIIDFPQGQPVKLDSPKRFIQIFILFTIMQHEEALKISKTTATDEQVAEALDRSRIKFYTDLGITEEDYATYGNRNGEKIAQFLADNPDFQRAYDFILEQGTEF